MSVDISHDPIAWPRPRENLNKLSTEWSVQVPQLQLEHSEVSGRGSGCAGALVHENTIFAQFCLILQIIVKILVFPRSLGRNNPGFVGCPSVFLGYLQR